MQNLLVTGGAGYIGSRLVPILIELGYYVRVLDLLLFNQHVFDRLNPNSRLEVVRADIRDRETVDRSLEDIDAVIHLAAISNDSSCMLDPLLTREVNFDSVKCLVDGAKCRGVKRFVNTSSASIYGSRGKEKITEEFKLNPLSLYAKYKAESEAYVIGENSRGFLTTSIRVATLCGYSPRQRLDLIVNTFTYQAIYKGKITVFGGGQIRPNLTLPDIITVYLSLLEAEEERIAGEVFNVGFENYRVIEIAHIVRDTLGLDVEIEISPISDQRSYGISSEKIHRALGIRPKYRLGEAVNELQHAFDNGCIPDPDHSLYYNVRFLTEKEPVG